MTVLNYAVLKEAGNLPAEWENIAGDYFQRREFLTHLEKYNKCGQKYYVMRDETGAFLCGAIVYTLKQDLLTFLKIPSPLKMNFVGVPCSVSSGGLIGREAYCAEMAGYIMREEKGMTVGLNLTHMLPGIDCACGNTLPVIVFENRFSTFEEYKSALRSDYKRRYKIIAGQFMGVRAEASGCDKFTVEMYGCYIDVLKRSKGKLETLSYDFFRNLPEPFELSAYYAGIKLLGWHITLKDLNKFYFFLGGINYALNEKYATYINQLYNIIKKGIDCGYKIIDLGQTAEIPKMRLGGELHERFMFGFHSNGLMNSFLKTFQGLLVYGIKIPAAHVFRSLK